MTVARSPSRLSQGPLRERHQNERSLGPPIPAILLAGVVAGTLHLIGGAMIVGGPPLRGFQSIASGLLGSRAFDGGLSTAVLGAALHYAICLVASALFWAAACRWTMLSERWLASGLVFGVLAYVVMNLIVVPLSKAPAGDFSPLRVAEDLVAHALLFGIPIAGIVGIRVRTS